MSNTLRHNKIITIILSKLFIETLFGTLYVGKNSSLAKSS